MSEQALDDEPDSEKQRSDNAGGRSNQRDLARSAPTRQALTRVPLPQARLPQVYLAAPVWLHCRHASTLGSGAAPCIGPITQLQAI